MSISALNVNQFRLSRLKKLKILKEHGIDPFPSYNDNISSMKDIQIHYSKLKEGEETRDKVSIAGRIMSYRNNGMFLDLLESNGKLQVFCHKKFLTEKQLFILKKLDVGDFIAIQGIVRRTMRGEITINAEEIKLLTKSLLPLPEKYHGLTNVETRYRQRYLDLIMNKNSRDILRTRSKIIFYIRHFLENKNFLEVETPMLQTMAGGATAKPFTTYHNKLDLSLYLKISPELYLKRLMVGGLSERIFEINRCFRNEGISPKHNPEFTMIEIYQAYANFIDMMSLTESLVVYVAQKVLNSIIIFNEGEDIHLNKPWKNISMLDLVKEKTGIDFSQINNDRDAQEEAKKIGLEVNEDDTWGKIILAVFEEKIESSLIQPIHVTHYPKDVSPLAKIYPNDLRLTERFETFINGYELANAFSELSDPIEQRSRFESQMLRRDLECKESNCLDEDFLIALEYGMPPTGGLGIGIDRLVMLLTGAKNIKDVIAFPTMKIK